jgi:hypothetical protein
MGGRGWTTLLLAVSLGGLASGCGSAAHESSPTSATSTSDSGGAPTSSVSHATAPRPHRGPGNPAFADEVTLYINDDHPGYVAAGCWPDSDPDPHYLAETKDPGSRRYHAKPYRCDIREPLSPPLVGVTHSGQAFWLLNDGTPEASCSDNEIRVSVCTG